MSCGEKWTKISKHFEIWSGLVGCAAFADIGFGLHFKAPAYMLYIQEDWILFIFIWDFYELLWNVCLVFDMWKTNKKNKLFSCLNMASEGWSILLDQLKRQQWKAEMKYRKFGDTQGNLLVQQYLAIQRHHMDLRSISYIYLCLCGKEKTWGKRSRRKRHPRREQLKECRLWFGWPRRLAANGGGRAGGGVGGWESCSFSSAGGFTALQHQHRRAAFANTPYINCWQSNQAHSSNFDRDEYLRMS